MKRMIALLVAVLGLGLMAESSVQAQVYDNGYLFGAGVQANCLYGSRYQREQPPYFAQFPPVYYGHIVKRPYGISPYAAPAGVAPVELGFPLPSDQPPVSKANPYFTPELEPVPEPEAESGSQDKITWRQNPFVLGDRRVASTR